MFQSLQRKTDLNAHLKKEIYSDYTAEWMACQRKYLASQNSFSTVGKGRKLLSIPADLPYQNDPVYSRIFPGRKHSPAGADPAAAAYRHFRGDVRYSVCRRSVCGFGHRLHHAAHGNGPVPVRPAG